MNKAEFYGSSQFMNVRDHWESYKNIALMSLTSYLS